MIVCYIMKKLCYIILSLWICLLWFTSFSSANRIINLTAFSRTISSSSYNTSFSPLSYFWLTSYCSSNNWNTSWKYFLNFTAVPFISDWWFYLCDSNQSNCFNLYTMSNRLVELSCDEAIYLSWTTSVSLSVFVYPNWTQLLSYFANDCSQDSNYLQCLDNLNITQASLTTLSWNYATCQSSLQSCQNSNDSSLLACISQKEECLENYNTLSWQYESLSNMNDSLSSQLQECLESWWTWDLSFLCNTFDINWSNGWENFSLPLTNNLWLPNGYKWYLQEWVVAIKPINTLENAYSIDDDTFQSVMRSYWLVFVYIFSGALFLVFLYTIRKYFIWVRKMK